MRWEAHRLSVEDRLDIQELFARYAWSLDFGDADGVVACFTPEGCLDHLWQGRLVGENAIRGALRELWYERPGWIGRQHLANHILLERDEADRGPVRARAFFTIVQFDVDRRTSSVFGLGTWDNRCVKRDGAWLFELVQVKAWREAQEVPWMGDSGVT